MNKKKKTNKKILNGCTPCLFTMRQEDQPFDKLLLGQTTKQLNDKSK